MKLLSLILKNDHKLHMTFYLKAGDLYFYHFFTRTYIIKAFRCVSYIMLMLIIKLYFFIQVYDKIIYYKSNIRQTDN